MGNTDRPKPPNAGKGRPKGVPNKATASVKAIILEAFQKRGGVKALLTWAATNETEFYKMWSRLAPAEHEVRARLTIEDLLSASRRLNDDH